MKKDLVGIVSRIESFLKEDISHNIIIKIDELTYLDTMKNNSYCNSSIQSVRNRSETVFMYKGVVY